MKTQNRMVGIWLLACAFLVFGMTLLGGVTRLTRSGLSMVEWRPLVGTLPPLSTQEWHRVFGLYQKSPEYQKVNKHMGLQEFKKIFYMEWAHRFLGRLIGLTFLLPFLLFSFMKALPKGWIARLLVIFSLGGLQGFMGWYMVKSGLVDMPRVSPYRLTIHLSLAFLLFALLLWHAWTMLYPKPKKEVLLHPWLFKLGFFLFLFTCVMILSGGFVAGNKAGLGFNTFPTMNGMWIPPALYKLSPWYLNWFENVVTVQFNHRMMAYGLCILVPFYGLFLWREKHSLLRKVCLFMGFTFSIQVGLGISTLLLKVPVVLASLHQAGSMVFLSSLLFSLFVLQDFVSAKKVEAKEIR